MPMSTQCDWRPFEFRLGRADCVVDDHRAAGLGQGIDVHHLDPEPAREFGRNSLRQLSGDAQADLHAMVPVGRFGLLSTQQCQDHTDRIDDRGPAVAHPLPIVAQAEAAIDGRAHARHHRAKHRNGETTGVEQRRDAEMSIGRAGAHGFAVAYAAADHCEMRQHDALRQSRRSAGIDDRRRIRWLQVDRAIAMVRIEQSLERLPSRRRRSADQVAPRW